MGKEKEKGTQKMKISQEISAKMSLIWDRKTYIQVHKAPKVPNNMKPKRNTWGHILKW